MRRFAMTMALILVLAMAGCGDDRRAERLAAAGPNPSLDALLNVADGLVFNTVADSILYVVRWDETKRAAVREGIDALAEVGLTPAGIVLNQVDPKAAEKIYGDGYAAYS